MPIWKGSHMPPGAIPAALHMLSVNGKQYQSMFTPHVLSLFAYQHPGQLLRPLLKRGTRANHAAIFNKIPKPLFSYFLLLVVVVMVVCLFVYLLVILCWIFMVDCLVLKVPKRTCSDIATSDSTDKLNFNQRTSRTACLISFVCVEQEMEGDPPVQW